MAVENPKQEALASSEENGGSETTWDCEGGWWSRFRPELTKVVSLIEMKLLQTASFQGLRESCKQDEPGPGSWDVHWLIARALKQRPNWCRNLNAAHQLNHELNQLLPLVATNEYLYVTLEYELKKREKDPEHRVLLTDLADENEVSPTRRSPSCWIL